MCNYKLLQNFTLAVFNWILPGTLLLIFVLFINKVHKDKERTLLSLQLVYGGKHMYPQKKKMESSRITITVSALSTITLILVTEQIINRTWLNNIWLSNGQNSPVHVDQ